MPDRNVVNFEVIDSIGIVTFNDPPFNQIDPPEFIPMDQFRRWAEDTMLKGIIIKGAGRNFSAGGKLDAIFQAGLVPGVMEVMMQQGHSLLNYIQKLEIPVMAAINRVCFGGGLEIALACHIRVASENALLAFPEVNQNLMPGLGGTVRLPAYAGFSQSAMMILAGDTVSATDARAIGFIDFISPKDMAFEFAWTMMQKMTRDRPLTVIRSVMKALKNACELSAEEAMREEIKMFCSLAKDEAQRRKNEED